MKKKYKFSVITAVYNIAPFLEEAIDSLIKQDIGFEENVQLILVDDGSTDGSSDICDSYQKRYPENIVVIHKVNGGVSSARNTGLQYIEGEFVNFMDGDDKLAPNTFSAVYQNFQKWPDVGLVTIPLVFFDGKQGNHILNNKFAKGTRTIDVMEEYWYPLLFINATFVTYERAKTIHFDERLTTAEDGKVVMQILLDSLCYGVVAEATYWYRRRTTGAASAIQNSTRSKAWYTNYIEYFAFWSIQESIARRNCVPRFVQYTLMYDLQWRYLIPNLPHEVLDNEELRKYCADLSSLLNYIDDRIILDQRGIYSEQKILVLKYKYGCDPYLLSRYDDIIYCYKDTEICKHSQSITHIDFIDIKNQRIEIEGYFMCYAIDLKNKLDWYLKVNEQLIPCEITCQRNIIKSLDETIAMGVGFKVTYPLTEKTQYNLSFVCKYNGIVIEKKKIRFGKFSPLQKAMWNSYYVADNFILTYWDNALVLTPYSLLKHVKRELSFLKQLTKIKSPATRKAFILRILLRIWNLFPHKEKWIITDRINKADDNGEAFFRYMHENTDSNVTCYYAIAKDSDEIPRLEQYGKVIPFGGWLYKWYYLCGAKIISSQGEDYVYRPLLDSSVYYSDIIQKNRFVFLQHGVIQNDLSGWLNRYNKNIHLFITTTIPEQQSILDYNYYYNTEKIQLTGLPRHDRLYHDEKKAIVFMPSWRSYLVTNVSPITGLRTTVNGFEKSVYFKMYNELLNHPKLIYQAKKLGYTVKLMIHPNMICTLPYFSLDSAVEILPLNESYRNIFAQCNMLVTDYSSVAFDFAYLRKPVLYYQTDKQEIFSGKHTFTEGYWDYERDGFGEVEYETDAMVERIIEYMENDCKLKSKYAERINQTFPFNDKNNCMRVYDAICKLT